MVAFLTVSLRKVATLAQSFLAITTLGVLRSESRTPTCEDCENVLGLT